jgi:hypothetical protein
LEISWPETTQVEGVIVENIYNPEIISVSTWDDMLRNMSQVHYLEIIVSLLETGDLF